MGGEDDDGDDRGGIVGGGCSLRHYHQLPKPKCDGRMRVGTTPTTTATATSIAPRYSTSSSSSSSSSSPPMTLSQVLNEKFRPRCRIDRRGVVDDDGGAAAARDARNGRRPAASLPRGIREATLQSSFDARTSLTPATMMTAVDDDETADNDDGASPPPCMEMIYHTRFVVGGTMVAHAATSDGSGKTGEDAVIDDSDDDAVGGGVGGSEDGRLNGNDDDDDDDCGVDARKGGGGELHDALRRVLDERDLPATSIVYLAIRGVLIYDRNRGGLVVTDEQKRFLLFGDPVDDDVVVVVPGGDNNAHLGAGCGANDGSVRIHERLTHHVLDEILSYSDDACAAVLPRVCKCWRDEIGTRSPQLWMTLLRRHGWPATGASDDGRVEDDIDEANDSPSCIARSRGAFVSHYKVARDVRALASASRYMSGGGGASNGIRNRLEWAMQIFKGTKGAPVLGRDGGGNRCIVKIWLEDSSNDDATTPRRALAVYEDCTLRLFEVVRGNSNDGAGNAAPAGIKCRQLVCLRVAPPSASRKKDSCEVMSVDLDDRVVACLVEESVERNELVDLVNPWMTVLSREDVVCAGNEGLLEGDCLKSHDLRGVILDHLLSSGATGDDILHEEMRGALHDYLASYDGETSDVLISVRPKLAACGRGTFLFSAFVFVPPSNFVTSRGDDEDDASVCGHRLFLFSTGTGTIVKSLHLDRNREGAYMFASRPFKGDISTGVLFTNALVSGPSMAISFISVEIKRDGTADIVKKSMIENEDFAPWSKMNAALTSSHAVFTTNPRDSCLLLHFHRISVSHNDAEGKVCRGFHSIEIGGPNFIVHNLVVIRDHYVAIIIKERDHDVVGEFDGHWFGVNEASFVAVVIHIPTREEIYRCPLPSWALSIDCVGDTLAMNVSNLGFVITGGNARDVARMSINEQSDTTAGVERAGKLLGKPGKNPKGKKKRLASGASGRKKDGFARGMSLRG